MSRRSLQRLSWTPIATTLAVIDSVTVLVALAVAYVLRFQTRSFVGLPPRAATFPIQGLLLFAAVFMVAFALLGLYQRDHCVSGWREYQLIVMASAATLLVVVVLAYLRTHPYLSRGFLFLSMILVALFMLVERFWVRRAIHAAAARGMYLDRIIVVGANQQAVAVARQLRENPSTSAEVVGFLSDYLPVGSVVLDELRVLGEPLQLERLATKTDATNALIVESGLAWESLRGLVQVMHRSTSLKVSLVPGLFDLHSTMMRARQLGPVFTLSPSSARIVGLDATLKRSLDVLAGAVGLVVAAPILGALFAIALLRGHNRPMETKYFVDGKGKFSLHNMTYPSWAKAVHLSRLTDLWPVFTGRISLVGPRAVPVERITDYAAAMPFLESAKPGFLGPWWLAGRAHPADAAEELIYDLYYLKNYSVWLDLEILIKSARGLFGGRRLEPPRSLIGARGSPEEMRRRSNRQDS